MSSAGATRSRSRRSSAAERRRSARRAARRRLFLLLGAIGVAAVAFALASGVLDRAVKEVVLPLRHEDIIRQQAGQKDLDPALIAAVIYTESHFRDQTSPAGAKGLMQLLPSTARDIARKSGGTAFVAGDLATPQVNISYGAWYLRHLLQRYGGNEVLAIAAYNAGEGKVDQWVARAQRAGERFHVASHIPFPETRNYVARVLSARRDYRRQWPRELGL